MTCSVALCAREAKARGWCVMHWKRWKRSGSPTGSKPRPKRDLADRFWSKTDKSGDCWVWTASRDPLGYGFFRVTTGENMQRAHRVAWMLSNGRDVPLGMLVCHHCDNPPCCNPRHLFLGTDQVNVDDRDRKGRTAHVPGRRGEASNLAKLTAEQVMEIRARYASGMISQEALGADYGIAQTQVGRIVRGKRWAHLPLAA